MKLFYGLLLVTLVFLISCGSSSSDSSVGNGASLSGVQVDAPSSPESSDNLLASDAKLVVSSTIALEVKDVRAAYLDVGRVARDAGGFLADATISDDERSASASVRMRIPADRHDDVLSRLRNQAGSRVLREATTTKEVSEQFTDLESRILNLQRSEAQYQQLLNQTGTIDQILAVNKSLSGVREEIERDQGRLRLLNDQIAMATIDVKLAKEPPASPKVAVNDSDLPGPVDAALGAAKASLLLGHIVANLVAVVAVFALWLVPIAVVGYRAYRFAETRHNRPE